MEHRDYKVIARAVDHLRIAYNEVNEGERLLAQLMRRPDAVFGRRSELQSAVARLDTISEKLRQLVVFAKDAFLR